jgi:hypothetical protein
MHRHRQTFNGFKRLLHSINEDGGPLCDFVAASTSALHHFSICLQIALQGTDAEAGALKVFTTRPDTLMGCTYMVIAPEHPMLEALTTPDSKEAVSTYVTAAMRKSDLERTELQKEKTGVFTGSHAVNPVNGSKIPIYVADYVLGSYGSGAIMAVPGHDERDFEFAQAFGLPVVQVCLVRSASENCMHAFCCILCPEMCTQCSACIMFICRYNRGDFQGVACAHLWKFALHNPLSKCSCSQLHCDAVAWHSMA